MAQNRQVGVTDFVLLDNVNTDSFMKNLEVRYVFKFCNVRLYPVLVRNVHLEGVVIVNTYLY